VVHGWFATIGYVAGPFGGFPNRQQLSQPKLLSQMVLS
jgi:hypothetical protein